ncbi:MAG: hypothetical protein L6R45_16985 [Anaerolineae bacterium]|nr:hypothetical protein [Anaerolineae bacterium]
MPGILDQLPNPSQLGDLSKMLKFDPQALGGGLQNLNIADMSKSIGGISPGESLSGLSLPALPASLSKDGFMQTLSQPLDSLKSFNPQTALGNLTSSPLPVNLPAPTFDINSPITAITSTVMPNMPGTKSLAVPSFEGMGTDVLDFSAFTGPLDRLANAGAATPTRLLNMLLKVADGFVATVTDTDLMVQLTIQALQEIYSQQIYALQGCLPLYAVTSATRLLKPAGQPAAPAFTARYSQLLTEIETLEPGDVDRLKKILAEGRQNITPALTAFDRSRLTLEALQANNTAALELALQNVLDLTGAGEVFLQKYFDAFGEKAHTVLGAIKKPVDQIGKMAGDIREYLVQAGDTAESTAKTVSEQIETNLAKAEQFLKDVEAKIKELEQQIAAFVEKLDVAPLVEKAKQGIAKVAEAIEKFFTYVEELKLKLDDFVKQLGVTVDEKLTAAFDAMEKKIRELLGMITGVLDRPEVKDALAQARQGIEKFKTTVDQASLKQVFDLVIDKTNGLETSIKNLNTAQMTTPQKTALKVGVKIIEQVKVDEIIKPELLAAFEEIRAPLAELITLLKEKALEIEKMIYEFNPGTVVNKYIVESEPYRVVMQFLDDFRPSKLLEPLKQANEMLTDIVRQLDPNILIDAVQQVYDQLAGLIEFINPAPLNRLIGDAVDTVVSMLGRIRDRELDAILDTVKETISLARLMEKTGLQEIAQADFWDMLQKVLGGGYLDEISQVVDELEKQLAALAATLDFSQPQAALAACVADVDRQLAVNGLLFRQRAVELQEVLVGEAAAIQQLEERRKALLKKEPVFPEITALLGDLDLAPLFKLQPAVAFVVGAEAASLDAPIMAVNAVLRPKADLLRALGEGTFQDAAVIIFRKQIGDPVRALIAQLQADLKPFKTAIKNIQSILITLTELPKKIDDAVAKVLDTARDSIKKVITQTISAIQAFQDSLVNTLTMIYERIQKIVADLSPYWLLNSFAASDFAGASGDSAATPPGMMAMARRVASGSDSGSLRIAAVLQTKLSDEQLTLLKSEATDTSTSLQAGNRANVLLALNGALRDRNVGSSENIEALKASLDAQIRELQTKPERKVEDIKKFYRCSALRRQLVDAWVAYNSGENKANALIRLNRVALEAAYPDDLGMSLQSLHPFIVENVAHLYPEQTVERLDQIYVGVVNKVKELPDRMIRAPLDDEFNKIKTILKENFDISGIFAVLEIKVEGLDEDLAEGLDRLSMAYNRLLQAFDQKLSAA